MKVTVFLKNISLVAAGLLLVAGVGFGQKPDDKKKDAKVPSAKDKSKDKNAVKAVLLPAPT